MSTTEEATTWTDYTDFTDASTVANVYGDLNNTGNHAGVTLDKAFETFRAMQFVYHQVDKIVLIVCYLPVFLLAVVANTLVIVVVLKFHYMRSITNYFLVNLSVADLLVTLICMPMAVGQSITRLWLYSEPMCKLTYYLQGVAVGASVFTITAMSIDRYLAIRHPMAFRNIFNRKTTLVMIVVLWGVALTIFAPLLWVRKTIDPLTDLLPANYPRRVSFCSEIWEPSHRMIYGTFCFVTVYAVPGIVIMLAYSLMGRQLCSASPPFDGDPGMAGTEQGTRLVRERRRVARILLLLATLFALCWLPYNLLSLCLDLGYDHKNLVDAIPFALLLGHANSAINPILYCFMTKNFRRTVKEVLVKSKASLAERQHQKRKIRSPFRSVTTSSGYASYHSPRRRQFSVGLRTFRTTTGATAGHPHAGSSRQYKQDLYQPHIASTGTSGPRGSTAHLHELAVSGSTATTAPSRSSVGVVSPTTSTTVQITGAGRGMVKQYL